VSPYAGGGAADRGGRASLADQPDQADGRRPRRPRMRCLRARGPVAALAIAVAAGACELREISVASPDDIVVAEVVLRAHAPLQTALLHRTRLTAHGYSVPGAEVVVFSESGVASHFREAPLARCLAGADDEVPGVGSARAATCYVAEGDDAPIVLPGARYSLRVRTADGAELTGTTRVPGAFSLRVPATERCALPAGGSLTLAWSPADEAWAYLSAARFTGLRAALAPATEVPEDPLSLSGVSISRTDTTIALPAGFGLFDRFDADLAPVLVALQAGIPAGVTVHVTVAAADRNFINWVRGGNFNPSGLVRVPSVRGGGTGMFGSAVLQWAEVVVAPDEATPAC
jgi:hypothetical protein